VFVDLLFFLLGIREFLVIKVTTIDEFLRRELMLILILVT